MTKIKQTALIFIITFIAILPCLEVRAYDDNYYPNVEIQNIRVSDFENGVGQIEWLTNVPTQGVVWYGKNNANLNFYVNDVNSPSRIHKVEIGGLDENTEYYFEIIVTYNGAERVRSFVEKFKTMKFYPDEPTPYVYDVQVPEVGGSYAVVQWKTDVNSTSVVNYGLDGQYNKKSYNSKKVKDHVVVLKNLAPNTQYFIRVSSNSKNKNPNVINYVYRSVYTQISKINDKDKPYFVSVRPSGPDDTYISATNMMVDFRTNRLTSGTITAKARGEKTQKFTLEDNYNHIVMFNKLTPDTMYEIKISTKTMLGQSLNYNFKVYTKALDPNLIPFETIDNAYNVQNYNYSPSGQFNTRAGCSQCQIINTGAQVAGRSEKMINYNYTPASALYKQQGTSQIYAIVNNQKTPIASPASFAEYGYSWKSVKAVPAVVVNSYPRAKLAKSPNSSTIYYLSQRPNGKIIKINIPSPQVFNSYPGNKWSDVVTLNQIDINSYPDAKLVKSQSDGKVYLLENGRKRYISAEEFVKNGYNWNDVVVINQTHLDSYK